eukprot:TRINITY_DN1337_c0_g1_i1.p1 TRINITY_DN1337_c0_g1~~TRINITY_DN1337_c0_g1_i1.p1  ORF type:complete len:298 (-),score=70.49 TRINITY_DN1337_c0_g1_i1:1057-1950(-)
MKVKNEIQDEFVRNDIDVTNEQIESFDKEGFVILDELIIKNAEENITILRKELENVMNGVFNTNNSPDKMPTNKNKKENKTLQIINVWKANKSFYNLVRSSNLGRIVSKLAQWKDGARLAQDQVWVKPPHSGPLSFHRDSTYFDFDPSDVVTVWISFDNLKFEEYEKLGPLEYVCGSHKWIEIKKTGSANQFFDPNYKSLVEKASKEQGIDSMDLRYVKVSIPPGGCSIHNGKTWHGSGFNTSDNPRRGMGIHFIPANAKFSTTKKIGRLWMQYKNEDSNDLPDDYMPIVWSPKDEK